MEEVDDRFVGRAGERVRERRLKGDAIRAT
jgi:hypothetical protein